MTTINTITAIVVTTTSTDQSGAAVSSPLTADVLIELMRLASPALPVGGFSYSEVLEVAVDEGLVRDVDTARQWLLDQLDLSLSRCDLPLVADAHDAWRRSDFARVGTLNGWVTTVRESGELQQQTQQMGRSLVDWLRRRCPGDAVVEQAAALQPAPAWPVVFALAAARCGAPVRESLLTFGLGWAENMVQAAIKAVPLGQSAGQRLLDALVAALPQAVDAAIALPPDQRQAFAPMLAILSARHETQYSRLFRS